jgi:hypothetical protein
MAGWPGACASSFRLEVQAKAHRSANPGSETALEKMIYGSGSNDLSC